MNSLSDIDPQVSGGLSEEILRTILGQVSLEDHVFDHDDIEPSIAHDIMEELLTYHPKRAEKIEDADSVELSDFRTFMGFR